MELQHQAAPHSALSLSVHVIVARCLTVDFKCSFPLFGGVGPIEQGHFECEDHDVSSMTPNVRAKRAPTVGRAGPVGENVQRTAYRARAARRWGSA